jgi:hypothetical protein
MNGWMDGWMTLVEDLTREAQKVTYGILKLEKIPGYFLD